MNIIQLVKKIVDTNKNQIYNLFSSEALLRIVAWYVTPIFYYLRCSLNLISVIALFIGLYAASSLIFIGSDYVGYGVVCIFYQL